MIYGVIGLALAVWVVFVVKAAASRTTPELGLISGQLRPCPNTPNCVNSEAEDGRSHIEALVCSGSAQVAWAHLRNVVLGLGGKILREGPDYYRVVFTTPIMRYRDDVEMHLVAAKSLIHIRSASRVGHTDLGANRKRVERIRAEFEHAQSKQ